MAAALAAVYLGALVATMDVGFTRDEGYYFKAGELYAQWFDDLARLTREGKPLEAFSRRTIDRHFSYNPEHPALPKILFGLSWRLFGRMKPPGVPDKVARSLYRRGKQPEPLLGIAPESVAFRMPGALSAALLLALIYLFGARAYSRRAGLVAAFAFALLPRAWFHAHLACFDMPVALVWFACVYAFWRSLDGGWRWPLLTGVAFGLALSTKHNSWFLPFVFGLMALLIGWRSARLRRGQGGLSVTLPPIPPALLVMLIVGPLLAFALWPRMWFDTAARTVWYVKRHLGHEYYWAYFFGTLYTKPPFPWHFPFTMTAVTVPIVTLGAALLGIWRVVRGHEGLGGVRAGLSPELAVRRRRTAIVVLTNLVFPIAVFSTTRTPIFGGTKHWLPAMPFLALLAGVGVDYVLRHLCAWLCSRPRALRVAAQVALGALLAASAAYGLARAHPNSSSYYNALLGGAWGMGECGMQREFWGNSSRPVLPWLNEHLPPNAKVYFQDTNRDSVRLYKRDGLLRHDIRPVRDWDRADYTLFHHHKEFSDSEFTYRWKYGDPAPVAGVYQEGVPLLSVYRNRAGWRGD